MHITLSLYLKLVLLDLHLKNGKKLYFKIYDKISGIF